MKLVAFAIFDVKAGVYSPPFFARSAAEGTRLFWDLVNDPQTPFQKHPDDYRLFKIGIFDQATAEWTKPANGVELWEEGSAVRAGVETARAQREA